MSSGKETLTLSLPPGTKKKIEAIACRLGIFWGKSPSPSGLVVAIAENRLEVGEPFSLNSQQVKALQQATKALIDTGYVTEAKIISQLLLDRGNLETPLRQAILQQISQPSDGWRILVDQHINNKQPFRLLYTNSQGQELEFTVYYAQVDFHEKLFYLNIWCEETQDLFSENHRDFPELVHNRCLKFEHIKGIIPMEGEWRGSLDHIKVELQFRGYMVKTYEPKKEDISDKTVDETRNVVREIFNPFWLIREIRSYGKNCIVLAPESIRNCIKQKLLAQYKLYK